MTLKERIMDFLITDPEEQYDKWGDLKSFFAGILIASIVWAMAWACTK